MPAIGRAEAYKTNAEMLTKSSFQPVREPARSDSGPQSASLLGDRHSRDAARYSIAQKSINHDHVDVSDEVRPGHVTGHDISGQRAPL